MAAALLCRLLQEQMAEDAAVAAQRASLTGELSTPGAYGSLDTPDAETASGNDGITIHSEEPTSDTADTTAAGSTASAKPSLEAATRDPSQSVAGSGGPVDSQSREGQVVEQLNGGQTAGIVIGVLIAAGVVAVGAFAYQRHRKNKQEDYITRYRRYDGGIEMQ
jgi:hypothetical protein